MLISDIIGFFTGEVELYAERTHRDGLVRVVSERGVKARIEYCAESEGVKVTLSPRNAKKIASALDKSGVIVYINSVCGFKDICIKNCKRLGLAVGAIVFCALLAMSTLFVFKVEVSGSELISKEQIKSELADFGIRVGARMSDIDRAAAASAFMQLHPEYSWAALNFKGTTVCLELKERTDGQSSETENADILVAKSDGIVKEVLVYSGKSSVKAGDVVKKGDILISGYISGNGLQYSENPILRFDGAKGSVKAEVSESFTVTVPFEEETSKGKSIEKTGIILSVLGFEIRLGDTSGESAEDSSVSAEKNVTVMGSVELPITYRECLTVTEVTEITVRDELLATAEAEKRAYGMLNRALAEAELTELELTKEITDTGVTVTVSYGCIREIAVPLR